MLDNQSTSAGREAIARCPTVTVRTLFPFCALNTLNTASVSALVGSAIVQDDLKTVVELRMMAQRKARRGGRGRWSSADGRLDLTRYRRSFLKRPSPLHHPDTTAFLSGVRAGRGYNITVMIMPTKY